MTPKAENESVGNLFGDRFISLWADYQIRPGEQGARAVHLAAGVAPPHLAEKPRAYFDRGISGSVFGFLQKSLIREPHDRDRKCFFNNYPMEIEQARFLGFIYFERGAPLTKIDFGVE
ncbi:MAG: hypothetical protein CM15mP103_03910 [Gammaproteobacteria bacterium]|nr:MAG: hypothetical protein CM15mP103_03910 [Gammaproteobacteria bacterium]